MKQTFTDLTGKTWTIPELTLGHVMAINRELGIELNEMISSGHLYNSDDSAMLSVGAVLWQLCKGQHVDVDEEQFFRAFNGDTFATAQAGLATAVADFIPSHHGAALRKQLEVMRTAAEKGSNLRKHQAELLEQVIDAETDETLLSQILETMIEKLGAVKVQNVMAAVLSKNASSEPENQELAIREPILSGS